jgi:hypothetical protein
LETAPQNQAILVLAGEAAARRGQAGDALRSLTEAFRLNEEAPRDPERARRIYERMREVDPEYAVSFIYPPSGIETRHGIFDSPDGRRFVRAELTRISSPNDPRARTLDQLLACDAMEQFLPLPVLERARAGVALARRRLT